MRAIERVMKEISEKGLKVSQVERSAGVANGYLRKAEARNGKIGTDILERLAKHLGVTAYYLMYGDDNSLNTGQMSNASEPESIYYKKDDNLNMLFVPIKAVGGFLRGYSNRVFKDSLEYFHFPFIKGQCFAFEVENYSMVTNDSNSINPGDYVVCTEVPEDWLTKGKIYVFQTIDGLLIKVFDRIENDYCYLRSLNNDYNPVDPIPVKSIKKIYYKEYVIKK